MTLNNALTGSGTLLIGSSTVTTITGSNVAAASIGDASTGTITLRENSLLDMEGSLAGAGVYIYNTSATGTLLVNTSTITGVLTGSNILYAEIKGSEVGGMFTLNNQPANSGTLIVESSALGNITGSNVVEAFITSATFSTLTLREAGILDIKDSVAVRANLYNDAASGTLLVTTSTFTGSLSGSNVIRTEVRGSKIENRIVINNDTTLSGTLLVDSSTITSVSGTNLAATLITNATTTSISLTNDASVSGSLSIGSSVLSTISGTNLAAAAITSATATTISFINTAALPGSLSIDNSAVTTITGSNVARIDIINGSTTGAMTLRGDIDRLSIANSTVAGNAYYYSTATTGTLLLSNATVAGALTGSNATYASLVGSNVIGNIFISNNVGAVGTLFVDNSTLAAVTATNVILVDVNDSVTGNLALHDAEQIFVNSSTIGNVTGTGATVVDVRDSMTGVITLNTGGSLLHASSTFGGFTLSGSGIELDMSGPDSLIDGPVSGGSGNIIKISDMDWNGTLTYAISSTIQLDNINTYLTRFGSVTGIIYNNGPQAADASELSHAGITNWTAEVVWEDGVSGTSGSIYNRFLYNQSIVTGSNWNLTNRIFSDALVYSSPVSGALIDAKDVVINSFVSGSDMRNIGYGTQWRQGIIAVAGGLQMENLTLNVSFDPDATLPSSSVPRAELIRVMSPTASVVINGLNATVNGSYYSITGVQSDANRDGANMSDTRITDMTMQFNNTYADLLAGDISVGVYNSGAMEFNILGNNVFSGTAAGLGTVAAAFVNQGYIYMENAAIDMTGTNSHGFVFASRNIGGASLLDASNSGTITLAGGSIKSDSDTILVQNSHETVLVLKDVTSITSGNNVLMNVVAAGTVSLTLDNTAATGTIAVTAADLVTLNLQNEAAYTGDLSLGGATAAQVNVSSTSTLTGSVDGAGVAVDDASWLLTGSSTVGNLSNNGLVDLVAQAPLGTIIRITATDGYTQTADGSLRLAIDGANPAAAIITTSSAILSGTLVLAGMEDFITSSTVFSGTSPKASDLAGLIANVIDASAPGGITGDFTSVSGLASGSGIPDYVALFHGIDATLQYYQVGLQLAWLSGTDTGHGTFTLPSGTDTFTVDVVLSDQTGPFTSGWDGISLTKEGDGTLILSAENTYTGATQVNAGVLANTGKLVSAVTVTGGTLNNSGTAGIATVLAGLIDNSGLINSATVHGATAILQNSGTVDFAALLGSTIINDGLITTATVSGGSLTNNTPGEIITLLQTGGTVANNADATIGTFDHTGGFATNAGLITTATVNGTASLTSTGTVTAATLQAGNLGNNTGGLIGSAVIEGGVLSNITGATVTTLDQTGGFTSNAGLIGSGTLGGGLLMSGGTFTALVQTGGTAYNTGTIATLDQTGGAMTNNAGGVIISATVSASLQNHGTIGTLTQTGGFGVANNASGVISTLATITNGLLGSVGTINAAAMASTGTLLFAGGTLGTVANDGVLNYQNAAAYVQTQAITGSGTIQRTAPTGNVTFATSVEAGALDIMTGKVIVAANGSLTLTGLLNVAASGTLGIDIGAGTVNAGSANFNTTGALDITGYTIDASATAAYPAIPGGAQTVIHTTGGITGFNPARLTVLDQASVDFLKVSATNTGFDLIIDTLLRWNLADGDASGDFTLASGTFTINAPLADNVVSNTNSWDGKSLTKLGAGTLVLAGVNTYTGTTTVAAGILENTGLIGGALVNVTAGELANTGTISAPLTNSSTLTNTGLISGAITNTALLANNTGGSITGVLASTGTVTNSGTIATLDQTGGITTNAGLITTATLNASAASLTNTGTVGTATVLAGLFDNSGLINSATVHGATAILQNSGTVDFAALLGSTIINDGLITTATVSGGSLTNNTPGEITTLLQTGGTVANNADATVTTLDQTGGITTNAGLITSATLNAAADLTNTGTVVTASLLLGALTNDGLLTTAIVSGGTLTNNTTGTMSTLTQTGGYVENHGLITSATVSSTANLVNSGSLTAATLQAGYIGNEAGGVIGTAVVEGGNIVNNGGGTITTLDQTGGGMFNGGLIGSATLGGGLIYNLDTLTTLVQTGGLATNDALITTATTTGNLTNTTTGTIATLVQTAGLVDNAGIIDTTATITGGTLANTGTINGATIGTAGTLLFDSGTLGTIAAGGILDYANAAAYAQTQSITGSGTILKTGAGLVSLDADNAGFTGLVTVSAGTLALNYAGTLLNASLIDLDTAGATLLLGADQTVNLVNGIADTTIDLATFNLAIASAANGGFSGTMLGSGTLIKDGAASSIYTLTGTQALAENMAVNSGFLKLAGMNGYTGATKNVFINTATAWLDLSDTAYDSTGATANEWSGLNITGNIGHVIGSNDNIIVGAATYGFDIGTGSITGKQGVFVVVDAASGTAFLTGSNNYVGYTRIDSGVLAISGSHQLGSETGIVREVILNGGDLAITADYSNTARDIELRASGAVDVASAVSSTWNNITETTTGLALAKTGAGELALAGNLTTGTAIVSDGALTVNGSTQLDTLTVDAPAAATFNGLAQITTLAIDGALTTGGTLAAVDATVSGSALFSGPTAITGTLDISGTAVITGSARIAQAAISGQADFLENTTVENGLTTAAGSLVTIAAGKTLALENGGTLAADLLGTGTLFNKAGALAAQNIAGSLLNALGATAATGDIAGNAINDGELSAGAIGGNAINTGSLSAASVGGTLDNINSAGIAAPVIIAGIAAAPAAGTTAHAIITGDITGLATNEGLLEIGGLIGGGLVNTSGTTAFTATTGGIITGGGLVNHGVVINLKTVGAGLVDNTGLIVLATGNSAFNGGLSGNGGIVTFATRAEGTLGETLTLASLSGSQTFANLMVNFADASKSSLIVVTGTASGAHSIGLVRDTTGGWAINPETFSLTVVSLNAGDATFAANAIDDGMFSYLLQQGDGSAMMPDANRWYLSVTSQSRAADAILSTAGALGTNWHYSLDSLYLRMGDLRAAPRAGSGSLWARASTYRLNAGSELAGYGFTQDTYGITAGMDKAFAKQKASLLAGAFLQVGDSDRNHGSYGDSSTTNAGAGAYLAYLHQSGWYAGGILKFDRYRNDLSARATDGFVTRARYNSNAQGLGVEAGRRIALASRAYWVEPSVQAEFARLNAARYEASNGLDVRVGSADSRQYRAQIRAGADYGKWRPYVKFAQTKTDTNGGEVNTQGRVFQPNVDGWRFETGIGASYLINPESQVYADYEYGKAQAYERPWAVNIGYRRAW